MIIASSFVEPLRALGYRSWSGVPCSFLTPFINRVIDDPGLAYTGAASEGEAVGISFGAYLAGSRTVTMCQNSGLGNMVNPLTSLNYPFRVPTLLITTWRGEPGVADEPQHEQMGRIMHRLLDTLEIPWLPFPRGEAAIPGVLAEADAHMRESQRPFALVMSKDSVAPNPLLPQPAHSRVGTTLTEHEDSSERLTRTQALKLILEELPGGEAIIATTGKTGRELFTVADRPGHLYVVGGMGTASGIGLGVASTLPRQRVVVIDGDGAALMKLGSLATIGWQQPANLLHIILDNEAHDSTGGQHTAAGVTRFAAVGAAANYRTAIFAVRPEDISQAIRAAVAEPGPTLLHIKIRLGSPENLGRPTIAPHEVKERFMAFLQST